MKRRDFLSGAAGLIASGPIVGFGESRPCPPSRISTDVSSVATQACGTSQPPAWVPASHNQWSSLPATSMFSRMSGYASPGSSRAGISAYSGGCIDDAGRQLYFIGGGHADYAGNEVLRLDLASDNPQWSVIGPTVKGVAAPTPNPTIDAPYYVDARDGRERPCSRHTYWAVNFLSASRRIMTVGAYAIWGSGNTHTQQVDAFDLGLADYLPRGSFGDCPIQGAGRSSCVDENGEIWVWNAGIAKLSGSKWTSYGNPSNEPNTMNFGLAFDPDRKRILRRNELGWRVCDLSSETPVVSTPKALAESVLGPVIAGTFHYSKALGCFVFLKPDTRTLFRITPRPAPSHDFDVSQIVTTGTPPAQKSEGSYFNSFLWLESLSVAVAIENAQSDVRVLRLA